MPGIVIQVIIYICIWASVESQLYLTSKWSKGNDPEDDHLPKGDYMQDQISDSQKFRKKHPDRDCNSMHSVTAFLNAGFFDLEFLEQYPHFLVKSSSFRVSVTVRVFHIAL